MSFAQIACCFYNGGTLYNLCLVIAFAFLQTLKYLRDTTLLRSKTFLKFKIT